MKLIVILLVTVLFEFSFENQDVPGIPQEPYYAAVEDPYDDYECFPETDEEIFYAYVVDIYFTNGKFCTGTLISQTYVLTAAHCVLDSVLEGSQAIVSVGNHDPWDPDANHIDILSKNITTFKNGIAGESSWLSYTNYDIALIGLSEPVEFSNDIKAATLPSWSDAQNDLTEQESLSVSWHTRERSEEPVVTRRQVKRCLHTDVNSLCTGIVGNSNKHSNACEGSAGAPLIIGGKVYGVATKSNFLCDLLGLLQFTKVTNFLEWISENTDVVIGHSPTLNSE